MRVVSILFLIHEKPEDLRCNLQLFTEAAIKANIQVAWGIIDSLELSGQAVLVRGNILTNSASLASYEASSNLSLSDFETIWVLSLGHRSTFLDKIQLLHLVPQSKLINNCDALLHLNSKYALASLPESIDQPSRIASSDPASIKYAIDRSGSWIFKPPAESHGRSVYKIQQDDPNSNAIIEHEMPSAGHTFRLLESWLPEIEHGEKRVLMADGSIIGCYQRQGRLDHRTNLAAGATPSITLLSTDERTLCDEVAAYSLKGGARFIGIDLLYPYVVEINVVNPGGLGTLLELGEPISGTTVLDALGLISP